MKFLPNCFTEFKSFSDNRRQQQDVHAYENLVNNVVAIVAYISYKAKPVCSKQVRLVCIQRVIEYKRCIQLLSTHLGEPLIQTNVVINLSSKHMIIVNGFVYTKLRNARIMMTVSVFVLKKYKNSM